jgi:adenine deaminase
MFIEGNLVDVKKEEIYPARIEVEGKYIKRVEKRHKNYSCYILPGFIDAHIHIESSLLCPSRFAETAVTHGTTAVITDVHEVANVAGVEGIKYMMEDASIIKFFFALPSCVPASPFDDAMKISKEEIEKLMRRPDVVALGEVMDYFGVINGNEEILEKIEIAKKYGKPVDGHAPLLTGNDLRKYISYEISTDHECISFDEAREKQELGMKIMIREGSSAKNMEDLLGLDYNACFLVTDDLMVNDLLKGHVNLLIKKAIEYGVDEIKAIKMVTINPAEHYKLNMGSIEEGKNADIVIVGNMKKMNVKEVYVDGKLMAKNGECLVKIKPKKTKSYIKIRKMEKEDFFISCNREKARVNVIELVENQIITRKGKVTLPVKNGNIVADGSISKVAVVNRRNSRIGVGFVKLKMERGAIASSIAHDSHHIIVVGRDEEKMAIAVNSIKNGGIVAVGDRIVRLDLPIAGLMSDEPAKKVSDKLEKIVEYARHLGCDGNPFKIISFLALLVIPEIRISDKGLFDVNKQRFMDVVVEND